MRQIFRRAPAHTGPWWQAAMARAGGWRPHLPVLTTFVTVLSLAACFLVSVILGIGLEFLPLLDKADLFVTLAFYSTIGTVFLRLAVALYGMLHASALNTAADFIEANVKRRLSSRPASGQLAARSGQVASDVLADYIVRRRRRGRRLVRLLLVSPMLLLLAPAAANAGLGWAVITSPIAWNFLLLFGGGAWGVVSGYRLLLRGSPPRDYRYILAGAHLFLILGSFMAGGSGSTICGS